MILNKRGQSGSLAKVLLFILIGILAIVGIPVILAVVQGANFLDSLETSFNNFGEFSTAVLYPFLGLLLGLGGASEDIVFIMILTFILVSIIIIGTLDSVNIFGEDKQGRVINFVVGIIVSLIGVRFMPQNLWVALTAPSSAFVATILVGVPFMAMAFVVLKLKSYAARKAVSLFYAIFVSYLIFSSRDNWAAGGFAWIYAVFLILAIIMLFFDAEVRRLYYNEKHKADIEKGIGKVNLLSRQELRREMLRLQQIITDANSPQADVEQARTALANLKQRYRDASTT